LDSNPFSFMLPDNISTMRTQVGIIGAGPAGLLLAHLLHLSGIESVVLETRSREEIEATIRAGVLEQGTVDVLNESGRRADAPRRAAARRRDPALRRAEPPHTSFGAHGGRSIMVYAQHEVIRDLVKARHEGPRAALFGVKDVSLLDLDTKLPKLRFHDSAGAIQEITCDYIAGCDGFHGVSRPSIPSRMRKEFERVYPFGWFGILVEAPPATEELIYAYHERGFALVSTRSPQIQRPLPAMQSQQQGGDWPDARIWEELHARLAGEDGWRLTEGTHLPEGRGRDAQFRGEPMQYGRLFLAGDAAHIVPPTGAKGMNLAVADVRLLAQALAAFYGTGASHLGDTLKLRCAARGARSISPGG
jgi:p-hydroxybenzoate 3-monooxygenase